MLTLYAEQKKVTFGIYKGFTKTILKTNQGIIKAVFPPYQEQPKETQTTININCFIYQLSFTNNSNSLN